MNDNSSSGKQPLYQRVMIAIVCVILGFVGLNIMLPAVRELEQDPEITPSVGALSGIFPLVFVIAIIVGAVRAIIGYSEDTEEEAQFDDYWQQYGERLKRAYMSKFGGANSAFNSEVDKRVLVMMNNGRGVTRAIAKNWLKRMHKFTEAK